MANLDATIARLRALSKAEQEAFAAQIDLLLDQPREELLTDAQWTEIEARLDSGEELAPHEDVARAFRQR